MPQGVALEQTKRLRVCWVVEGCSVVVVVVVVTLWYWWKANMATMGKTFAVFVRYATASILRAQNASSIL